jgi:hypothetical protein
VPAYKAGGFTATIEILGAAGYTLEEEVLIDGVDLSWIRIISDNGEIDIDITTTTTTLDGDRVYSAVFAVRNGGKSPVIAADLISSTTTSPRRSVLGVSGAGSVINIDSIEVNGGFNCITASENGEFAVLGSLTVDDSYDANIYLETGGSIKGGGDLVIGGRGGSTEESESLYMNFGTIQVKTITPTSSFGSDGALLRNNSLISAVSAIFDNDRVVYALRIIENSKVEVGGQISLNSTGVGVGLSNSELSCGQLFAQTVDSAFLSATGSRITVAANILADGGDIGVAGTGGRISLRGSHLYASNIEAEANTLGGSSHDIMVRDGSILTAGIAAGTSVSIAQNTLTSDGIFWG